MTSKRMILLSAAGVTVLGLLVPDWILNLLLIGVSRTLVVVGLMILLRTGLVSFGHALYFSFGGYSVVLLNRMLGTTDLFLELLVAAGGSAALGFLVGFLVRGHKRIFFAMLNLALSMIFYGAIIKSEWLGSSDGFSVRSPTFAGFAFANANSARAALFLCLMAVLIVALFCLERYLRSTLGRLSEAVRDNDLRVEYLGYAPQSVVHINFVISAMLAGLAGTFTALAVGQVDPDSMANWTVSGEFVFVTVMSGTGSILAPLAGSLLFELVRSYAYELVPQFWNLVVGAVLLFIILWMPGGLSSLGRKDKKIRT